MRRLVAARVSKLLAVAAVLATALPAAASGAAPRGRPVTADPMPAGRVYTAAGWLLDESAWVRPPSDGEPATTATLDLPEQMLELADGSLLVTADVNTIYRVGSGGGLRLFAGGRARSHREGRPATQAGFDWISDLAQLPDGSVLVSEQFGDLIRRILPDGTIRTVAGTRKPRGTGGVSGFGGDGGPAVRAKLDGPKALAVLPDGSFLIADSVNNRVRRVSRAGRITTVAGDGRGRPSGDGGPATSAGVAQPVALSVQPDGGFLIAEGGGLHPLNLTHGPGGVRRVAPSGRITTLTRLQVRSLVATDDGGFLAAPGWEHDESANRIIRVDARGRARLVAGTSDVIGDSWAQLSPPFLNGIPPRATAVYTEDLAPARDGGVYFNDVSRIRYWAPADPRRLAIGIGAATLTSPLVLQAHVHLTRPATIVATARRDGQVVREATTDMPAGEHVIALGEPVDPGRYRLSVTATSAAAVPHRVSDTVLVYPGGVLTADAARDELTRLVRQGDVFTFRRPSQAATVTGCELVGTTRATCAIERPDRQCSVTSDVVLRPNGSVGLGLLDGPDRCFS
ncbi:NHL repeat-containing protein [Capillimicrobium parvum]|uniref:Uncharacterized protein n=1 Tax=Capillimicrobium parvum TaxID=2884022 RepID=A0A9E7C5M8_9ACTN|nr:hypothetical protein [Capillimicrobium parvum]UGS38669.1 hypothetical protein DSM104329_05099 [Capillimicrobium parvum]